MIIDQILDDLRNGLSYNEVAKKNRMYIKTVAILAEHGADLKSYIESGLSYVEASKRTGIPRKVLSRLAENGYIPKSMVRPPKNIVSGSNEKLAIEMYKLGHDCKKIAAEIGCAPITVSKWLRKNGIENGDVFLRMSVDEAKTLCSTMERSEVLLEIRKRLERKINKLP